MLLPSMPFGRFINLFIQVSMEEGGLDVDDDGIHLPNKHGHKEDPPCDIMHDGGKVFSEIHTWDLTIPTCNQTGAEDSITLNLKHPF